MPVTILPLPDGPMRNARDPVDGSLAARCRTGWMLHLSEGGEARLYDRDYYGGDATPMDEWLNRTLVWSIRPAGDGSVIDRDALEADLAEGGRLRALLERVHVGHSVDWDGSNNRGTLTDDAGEASDEIRSLLEDYATDGAAPEQWDATDWLTAHGNNSVASVLADLGLTADATGAEIDAAVARAESMAKDDSVEIVGTRDAIDTLIAKAKAATDDDDFVTVETADGYSIHAPGATDEMIASGASAYLISEAWEDDDHEIYGGAYDRARAAWVKREG